MTVRVEATADRQFRTNSYLVEDDETRDGVVIDANLEPESMIDLVRKRKANVRAILLTHTDVDHVGGLSALLDAFGPIPVAVHEAERHVVKDGRPLRRECGAATHPIAQVRAVVGGATFPAGDLAFLVRPNPAPRPRRVP